MKRYRLHNLDCAHCASDLEQALRRMEGVRSCSVNFGAGTLILDADDPSRVAARVPEIAAGVSVSESAEPLAEKLAHPASLNWLALVGLAAALVVLACALWLQAPVPKAIAFGVAYALVGWRVVLRAGRNLVRGRPLDESFLMTVATGGAFAIGEAPEAVGVMLFYRVGELLQEMAVGRARRSIGALLAIRPDYANLREGEEIAQVSPDAVAPGQVVVVRPGERVPLDGRVLSGSSHIDASLLSGEPVPRAVGEGDEVFGGTINQGGLLEIEVLRSASESSAAKILDLVENAAARKAPTERFIARFATYYTPAVVGLTLLVAFVPPLFIPDATLAEWVHRGLVLLVISCPCAFMLSIPLGYFGGIGGASRQGILVKGASYLDALAETDTVVFDKTGTLTRGVFRVQGIDPQSGWSEEEVLALAAHVEVHSSHPIAQSILDAYRAGGGEADLSAVSDYRELPGSGVTATVNGREVLACSHRALHGLDLSHDPCEEGETAVHVVVDGAHAGRIRVGDEVRSDARPAVAALRRLGVRRIGMLTGDVATTAERVARSLGLDFHEAELLPQGKIDTLERLIAERDARGARGRIAFVGDGVNDAPVLARADVGIAMGGLGSDAAIEAADVVVTADAVGRVPAAIDVARSTRRIVWQNIIMAMGIKALVLILGAAGMASMWSAVGADVGVAVAAVLNSTRILQHADRIATAGPHEH